MTPKMTETTTTTTTFLIPNLHCPSYITSIEDALATLFSSPPSPITVSYSLLSHSITINHPCSSSSDDDEDEKLVEVQVMVDVLEEAGFEVYSVVVHDASSSSSSSSTPHQWYPTANTNASNSRSIGDWEGSGGGGGGLERAIRRWRQCWKGDEGDAKGAGAGGLAEQKKRKQHVQRCRQCQKEEAALFTDSSSDWSVETGKRRATVGLIEDSTRENGASSNADEDGEMATIRECGGEEQEEQLVNVVVERLATVRTYRATFSVVGMTCGSCVGSVSRAISANPWVEDVNVGLLSNLATVTFRGEGNEGRVVECVEDVGYGVTLEDIEEVQTPLESKPKATTRNRNGDVSEDVWKATYAIGGMTCSSCVGAVTSELRKSSWIETVDVNLLSNSAVVTYHGDKDKSATIKDLIEDIGYEASIQEVSSTISTSESCQQVERERTVTIRVDGMYCQHCPSQILDSLATKHPEINLSPQQHQRTPFSLTNPLLTLAYTPHPPTLTLRKILKTISLSSTSTSPSPPPSSPPSTPTPIPSSPIFTATHHTPPTIAQTSHHIHRKNSTRILLHLTLAVLTAIPTFILAILYPSLLPTSAPGKQWLEKDILGGAVSRAEWGLFFCATVVFFLGADVFHRRGWGGVFVLWRGRGRRGKGGQRGGKGWKKNSTIGEGRGPMRRKRREVWGDRMLRFGSMDLLVSIGTSVAYFASVGVLAYNASSSSSSSASSSSLDDGSKRGGKTTTTTTTTTYYFDSVVFLTMFLLLGRWLEAWSKARTGDAVAELGLLRPREALLVTTDEEDGKEEERERAPPSPPLDGTRTAEKEEEKTIPVDLLEIGEIVRVHHGSSPPFDGVVVQGETRFDEASLTGEPRLVDKGAGDQVFSGTINKGNPITVRLTSISGSSMLDQIIRVVQEGQAKRAPVERVADVITRHFVPFIVLVGVLTWVIWLALGLSGALPDSYLDVSTGGWPFWSLQFSIAVFVIACPCGIGLAAPTALFVGGGIAAKNGILVKGGGEAFQEASMLDCIVFDKTGTLTQGGQPAVTDHWIIGNDESTNMMSIAKALEENSGHPVAASITSFCTAHGATNLKSHNVEEVPGKGMKGDIFLNDEEQVTAIIGNEGLMADYSVTIDAATTATIDGWKVQGKSIALMATRGNISPTYTLTAAFAISDPIRPEAASVIRTLQDRGLSVWLLSGDNQTTANTVAAAVGISSENVIAGVLPEQKADKIKHLQRTLSSQHPRSSWFSQRADKLRATVAMVGDGINDAPALATADVGIAIGSGSDVALSTASFVLIQSDLHALVTLITLSKKVFRRVWLNFAWALVYNMVGLPIAAGVLYPIVSGGKHVRLDPVWASLAMALSSVSVVMSSLALRSGIPGLGFRKSRRE